MTALVFWLITVINVVIFPFTAFNLVLLNTDFAKNVSPFIIISNSMQPSIPQGSLVYAIKSAKYKVGDVITFINNNENITHRIEKVVTIGGETYFSTRGDGNFYPDFDLVNSGMVLGKVFISLPLIGQALRLYEGQHFIVIGIIISTVLFSNFFTRSNYPLAMKRL